MKFMVLFHLFNKKGEFKTGAICTILSNPNDCQQNFIEVFGKTIPFEMPTGHATISQAVDRGMAKYADYMTSAGNFARPEYHDFAKAIPIQIIPLNEA